MKIAGPQEKYIVKKNHRFSNNYKYLYCFQLKIITFLLRVITFCYDLLHSLIIQLIENTTFSLRLTTFSLRF